MSQSTMLVKAETGCFVCETPKDGTLQGKLWLHCVPTAPLAAASSRAAAQGSAQPREAEGAPWKCRMFCAEQTCLQVGASRVAVHSLTADTHLVGQEISALH